MKKVILFLLIFCLFAVNIAAFEFNGTVYDTNRAVLDNALVNITVYTIGAQGPTLINSSSATTNATGWFNLSASDNSNSMLKLIITHRNSTLNFVDYVGQILPIIPQLLYSSLSYPINFYLKDAGTINITAVNSTGSLIPFAYMIKDTILGYEVSMNQNVSASGIEIYVPKNKNYSIMIWPATGDNNHFVPVSYEWNNFSSTNDFTFGSSINKSTYNATTRILNKVFNTSESFAWVSGYINDSSISSWDNFTIVPYVLEPSDMTFMSMGGLPYNTSAWRPGSYSDTYNLSNGFFNITLPYSATETVRYLLFAAAQNGSEYRGSYRNITVNGDTTGFNFTMYGLLGSVNNINMSGSMGGVHIVNTKKQVFNLVNSTSILQNANAHTETTVDYSNYGCNEITLMEDVSTGAATFYLPLLNVTGIKKMMIYTMDKAPKKTKLTVAEIQSNNNITLSAFSPGGIDDVISESDINISLYVSNSSCNVPFPPAGCLISNSNSDSFNPFSIVIGGGDLSLRMSYNNITVHYKNVNMLASGPPDAMFDSSANESESGSGLEAAWRFGSAGPEIYDEVLIGIPYDDTVEESAPFSILLTDLYDDENNWASIWNSTGDPNAENFSTVADGDYAEYNQSWFNNSAGGMNCSRTDVNEQCYVNTTYNMIWIKIPHFSGIGPTTKTTTKGNFSISTNASEIECKARCVVYINASNNNYTLSQSLQNVTINNTDSGSLVYDFSIYWYNNSDSSWQLLGVNATNQLNHNISLSNGSAITVNKYKININKSKGATTLWSFTYFVSGINDTLTLELNLTCTSVWDSSCTAWSTCISNQRTRTCTDSNSCNSSTRTETTSCSSGSSGGSGSASTRTSKTWLVLEKDETATISITSSKIHIRKISVKMDRAADKMRVDISKLSKAPSSVDVLIEGEVYQYLSITDYFINNTAIDNIEFEFRVEKSWLTTNNVEKEDIVLMHHKNDTWQELSTELTSEDSTYIYYKASSSGFSYYAIAQMVEEEVILTEEEEAEEEEVIGAEEEEIAEEEEEELAEKKLPFPLWAIIVLSLIFLAFVATVVYYVRKERF